MYRVCSGLPIALTPVMFGTKHFSAHALHQGMRLERVWTDLKLWWNKFHALKGGYVADDCQPTSAFSLLSDETRLATFLGFNNEDSELVKVVKALMLVQVTTQLHME